jgi:CRISPR-associated endonuclease Csn1
LLGGAKNAFGERWEYFKEFHSEIEDNIISIASGKNKEGEVIENIKEYLSTEYKIDEKQLKKLYHHSQETEKQEIKNKLDTPKNIRNPIVQQALYELKKVVNSVIEKYGKPDEIKVELARDLKQSKDRRLQQWYDNRDREKENDKARAKLDEFGLAHSRDNIQKYLLYKEIENQNGIVICPYTGNTIKLTDLLGKENKFQIEHIIPYSVSLDDSFANKTLCDSKENQEKGELTPYQFYIKQGADKWKLVSERAFKLLPYNKAKRFTSKTSHETDFISRQLNDTRYISKEAKNYMKTICEKITVLPGSLTAELRHKWGLNSILNPSKEVNTPLKKGKYWAKIDENKNIDYYPIYNKKPDRFDDEIIIDGEVKKGGFESNFLCVKIPVNEFNDGMYWAKIGIEENPEKYVTVFNKKPDSTENEIIISGTIIIDKKDNSKIKFEAKTLKSNINVSNENIKISNYENKEQKYWAKLKIEKKELRQETDKKKIIQNKNQIILFGEVKNNIFKSHIYECETDKLDGKYWTIINVDFDKVNYFKIKNDKPEIAENQIIIIGNIKENIFYSDVNFNHLVEINENKEDGKYWAVFEINKKPYDFQIIKNEILKHENNETIIEGTINQNEKTGNIEFLPIKSRDDHRHHAVDALTVALTELLFLNKLSHWNANLKDKQRGKAKEHLSFDMPWDNFFQDAKKSINEIIISHRFDNKVMTKITKTIKKKDKKFKSVGMSVRGQLHKEFVFGSHKRPVISPDGKFIIDENKTIIIEKDKYGNDKYYYHIRKSLTGIKNKKHINKIVDEGIKKRIIEHIKENYPGIDTNKNFDIPKDAFFKSDENEIIQPRIFLPNKNGNPIPVKKVRIREEIGNAVKLKEINQWVNPRNNHHIAIYENKDGELFEKVITLWEAVERKKQGLSVIDKNLSDGSKFIQSLERNEMFILGLSYEEFEDKKNNRLFLSKYLYRVQKLTSGVYTFTHNLVSNIDVDKYKFNPNTDIFPKVLRKSKGSLNGIKVKIDILGNIEPV